MDPSLSEMVTEGANRVGARGEASPQAATLFLLAVALTVAGLRARRSRGLVGAALVVVVACALPGLSTIARRRADSPARGALAAAAIERLEGEVEGFSKAHGCAVVRKSACAACDPIVDFALATSRTCRTPAPIVLGRDSIALGCTEGGGTLTCGRSVSP